MQKRVKRIQGHLTEIFYQHTKCFSPQLGVGGMIYWLFGKPIHAPVKEKIDCQQNSEFAWEGCLAEQKDKHLVKNCKKNDHYFQIFQKNLNC